MNKLFLVLCIGSASMQAYDLTPRADLMSTTTYQPYQPTIARQPITRAQRMQMMYQNNMLRLQTAENRVDELYAELSKLKNALMTDRGHAGDIQKAIDLVNDSIDQYEAQIEQYKKSLGVA